jgi:hypothetical protein
MFWVLAFQHVVANLFYMDPVQPHACQPSLVCTSLVPHVLCTAIANPFMACVCTVTRKAYASVPHTLYREAHGPLTQQLVCSFMHCIVFPFWLGFHDSFYGATCVLSKGMLDRRSSCQSVVVLIL